MAYIESWQVGKSTESRSQSVKNTCFRIGCDTHIKRMEPLQEVPSDCSIYIKFSQEIVVGSSERRKHEVFSISAAGLARDL